MHSVLVTAGPTRERIDPVRFISNYSTGTFGYAIAAEAKRRGLRTTLISGPTGLVAPQGVKTIAVESALDMRRAVLRELKAHDCLIMAAAVSDWRSARPAQAKIKRSGKAHTLRLVANPDILAEAAKRARGKVLAGFALETGRLEAHAMGKMRSKRLDLVIANRLGPRSPVFGGGPKEILILDRSGKRQRVKGKSKKELAKIILDKVLAFTI